MNIRERLKKMQDENLLPPPSNFSEPCILCGHYDCDCEDVLTPEEYAELVKKEKQNEYEVSIRMTLKELYEMKRDLKLKGEIVQIKKYDLEALINLAIGFKESK